MSHMSVVRVRLSRDLPKESRRKEIIKINVRIDETENKYMRLNKAKSWFYEKTNENEIPGNIHKREKKSTNKQCQK